MVILTFWDSASEMSTFKSDTRSGLSGWLAISTVIGFVTTLGSSSTCATTGLVNIKETNKLSKKNRSRKNFIVLLSAHAQWTGYTNAPELYLKRCLLVNRIRDFLSIKETRRPRTELQTPNPHYRRLLT